MIGGEVGLAPQSITLAYHPVDVRGDRWVVVTTGRQRHLPADWDQASWDWYDGGLDVLTRTDVDWRSAEGVAWREVSAVYNNDHESHYEIWSKHGWMIGAVEFEARSFAVAGTWVALSVLDAGLRLYVSGAGVAPDELCFGQTDGAPYGVDFAGPLHFPKSIKASRELAQVT
jgi:hypothetical protein